MLLRDDVTFQDGCFQNGDGDRLHGVLLCPLLGQLIVLVRVGLEDPSDLGDERVVWVGVTQQRADTQQHLADCESGGPLRSEYVEADGAVRVDVGVVDASGERNLWWLEGVVGGEVDGEEEDAALVGGVRRAHDGGLPVE